MLLLSEYDNRTAWKDKPIHGTFHTHEGFANKVNDDGSYAPFFGSTVVFLADAPCAQAIENMQTVLHREVGDMQTTIHNLSTPPVSYADSPLKEGAIFRLPL